MRYEVRLREAPPDHKWEYPGLINGTLIADVYRVTWFGLRKTKIAEGVSANKANYDQLIKRDIVNLQNNKVDFLNGINGRQTYLIGEQKWIKRH